MNPGLLPIAKELREIADLITSGATPRVANKGLYSDEEHGVPFFRIQNVGVNCLLLGDLRYVTKTVHDGELGKSQVKPGDILLTITGRLGTAAVVPATVNEANINQHICLIRVRREVADPDYVAFHLNSERTHAEIRQKQHGTTRLALNHKTVGSLTITLPPLDVQRKIALCLNRALHISEKRKQANLLASSIIQAVFLRILEAGKYPEEEIRQHVTKTEVRDPRKGFEERFKYVDIAGVDAKSGLIVEVKDLLGKDAPSRARKVIRTNDVIVSSVRPNLNATALVPPELDNQICSTGFSVLRCRSSLDPRYLYVYTRRPDFVNSLAAKMKGASYPAVTHNDVLDLRIPVAPIEKQKEFAEVFDRIRRISDSQGHSTHSMNELFQSLMQRAFKG